MKTLIAVTFWLFANLTLGETTHSPPTVVLKRVETPPTTTDLACSSILEVAPDLLKAQGNYPMSVGQWMDRLEQYGRSVGILAPFSRAPNKTSLGNPRVLMAIASFDSEFKGKRDLQKKLFLASVKKADGTQDMEFISWNQRKRAFDFGTIENFTDPAKRRVVSNESFKSDCMICHKTGGPIFPDFPWSGMTVDDLTAIAMVRRLHEENPKQYAKVYDAVEKLVAGSKGLASEFQNLKSAGKQAWENPEYREAAEIVNNATYFIDGQDTKIRIFEGPSMNRSGVFDPTVRDANEELLFPNDVLFALTPDQRRRLGRALVVRSLLAEPPPSAGTVFTQINPSPSLPNSLGELMKLAKETETKLKAELAAQPNGVEIPSSGSSRLRDFDQVKESSKLRLETSDESLSHVDKILAYDKKRQDGLVFFPKDFRPSQAAAFGPRDQKERAKVRLQTAPEVIRRGLDARIHLNEEDVSLIARLVKTAVNPPPPPAYGKTLPPEVQAKRDAALARGVAILKRALTSQPMDALLERGFPTREELIPTLLSAISSEIKKEGLALEDLGGHLNFPDIDECGKKYGRPATETATREKKDLTTGSCARCHVGEAVVGTLKFIFDPLDKKAWKSALQDPKTQASTHKRLVRVLTRLEDEDMPPDGSPEAKALAKDPKRQMELKALRNYLDGLK